MVACCLLTGISIQSEAGEALSILLMEEWFWTFMILQISASDQTRYTKICFNMKSWSFVYNFLYFLQMMIVSLCGNSEGTPYQFRQHPDTSNTP